MEAHGTSATTLNTVYIGQTPKQPLKNSVIAMPGATSGSKKIYNGFTDEEITISITPVPMPAADAAEACSCNTGNTCSISWKYY